MSQNSNDEISKIIDSIENDNTLEKKMDAFSQKKERKSRVQRLQDTQAPQKETEAGDTTVVLSRADAIRSFEPNEEENSSGTVVIDNDEVQSLLNEEKKPVLRREVVTKKTQTKKSPQFKMNTNSKQNMDEVKKYLIVVVVVLALFLAGFGIFKIVSSQLAKDDTTENTNGYQNVLSWANSYDTLTSSEKSKIEDYEAIYNSLTDEEKAEINRILEEKTGYNFDELLARAKSNVKKDTKNKNTENAEKKAKLKEQINGLKTELAASQEDYDTATSKMSELETKIDKLTEQLNEAETKNSEYYNATSVLQYLQSNAPIAPIRTDYESDEEYQTALTYYNVNMKTYNEQVASAKQAVKDAEYVDTANLSTQLSTAQTDYSTQESNATAAQSSIDNLSTQIAYLQAEYDSLK